MSFSCPGGLSQRNSPAGWTPQRQDWSAPMVIVAGHITVEPQQRKSYLAGCVRIVEQARGAAGSDRAALGKSVAPGARTADGRRCGGPNGLTVATEIREHSYHG